MERLQKFLAECGIGSRRKCEQFIRDGFVKVNGKIVKELGIKVEPLEDKVEYNNKIVTKSEKLIYIMLNKPTGYVTTVKDQFNRASVLDLIDIKERIYPVGRLDYNTSGLLLLTNDGALTYKLTHPKHEVLKTYIAEIKSIPSDIELEELRNGIIIDNFKTSKAKIKILKIKDNTSIVEVQIHEGRNRQIRRMFDYIKHTVIKLKREKIGEIGLGKLKIGHWRYLNDKEINYLKKLCL
ncbi:rRNA pseudouridine synthase [Aceticella autotrophica]|uniref:Pseudouridine synthase n=1 Tax=Aceticella autotrophica TaxID=2755338 RepID=A0A974Y3X0_9THEO|nr:pseudouridine synthase [Aceticella autotrophica]QSZ26397.1 rRNA pseudouridine synthase [Aceticella autotrophica]